MARYTPWVPGLWKWATSTEESFDLVAGMTIGFESVIAAGLAYANRRKVPYVCYPLTHLGAGSAPGDDSVSRFYTMRHQIQVVKASNAVIAQTPAEKTFYEKYGVNSERISVIGPGVNPDEVLGGKRQRFFEKHKIMYPFVLYIGYMSREKGAFDTVEAVRQLWRADRQVEVALVGTISSTFESYLRQLSDADKRKIHLLGPVDDSEKKDALDAAFALSMPSRTDSFGITYLEAWLYALPVIAAQTWGVTDVVEHGKDGLVVPFGDAHALAKAFDRLLGRPDEARLMGERGREKVLRAHTWDKKLMAISGIYGKLLET
jgi:glycosyltransferase involved in cell wall biosynthesis